MSIQSEINRISGNVSDALDAIEAKGVTIPTGANSDDLADLIGQISGGGGTGSITQDQDGYLVLSPDGGGGGGGGIDIPVFTATYNDNDELLTFVCNKTFAQVDAYFDNSNNCSAVLITVYPEDEIYNSSLTLNYDDWESATPNIVCTQVDSSGFPTMAFSFLRNGTLTNPDVADWIDDATFTQNGTYYSASGKVFGFMATVAVPTPTPTLVTKNITQNGTYNASSDNADGYSSVTVNVGSSNTATMTLVNNSPYTLEGWLVTTNGYKSFYLSSNSSTTITGIACRTYDGDTCPVFQLNASTGGGNYQATYQSPNWSSSTMTKYALTASQSLWQNNSLPVPSNNRTFTVTVSIAT